MNEGASQFLNCNDSTGSEGTIDNSPAVYCRVRNSIEASPEGTAENPEFSRPFGTRLETQQFPALKRLSIFRRPSGTEAFKHHTFLEN
jgi:hypothetical protein